MRARIGTGSIAVTFGKEEVNKTRRTIGFRPAKCQPKQYPSRPSCRARETCNRSLLRVPEKVGPSNQSKTPSCLPQNIGVRLRRAVAWPVGGSQNCAHPKNSGSKTLVCILIRLQLRRNEAEPQLRPRRRRTLGRCLSEYVDLHRQACGYGREPDLRDDRSQFRHARAYSSKEVLGVATGSAARRRSCG